MVDVREPQLNKVMLSGRTVHSAKTTRTSSGMAISKFSIACNEGYGDKKKTSFFDCVCFEKTAEIVEKEIGIGHGYIIMIEGRLRQETWEDKEGKKRHKVEIIVDRFHPLAWKAKDDAETAPHQKPSSGKIGPNEDDIPF